MPESAVRRTLARPMPAVGLVVGVLGALGDAAHGQAGDAPANALPIDALPFVATGSTIGFSDDIDEACPLGISSAPDVFYRYTPAADAVISVGVCEAAFDTKLYVCDSALRTLACNDDGCTDASGRRYRSRLEHVEVEAGETYYIVVDGFGDASGAYTLEVDARDLPCVGLPPFLGTAHALSFRRGDVVTVPDHPDLRFAEGDAMTLEAWVRPLDLGTSGTILSKSIGSRLNYGLSLGRDASVAFGFLNASRTAYHEYRSAPGTVELATWNHVAVTCSGFGDERIRLFVDGVHVAGTWNEPPVEGPFVGNADLHLGAMRDARGGQGRSSGRLTGRAYGRSFHGTMDDVRVWRTERTRDEIVTSMRTPLTGEEAGLVAHWTFDEGTGAAAADVVGGHAGAISGAAWRALDECRLRCDGDANLDDAVGIEDLLMVLGGWSAPGGGGDVTDDGIVDVQDLQLVLNSWGPCLQPIGACCVDGGCIELSASDCAAAGGTYAPGRACGDGVCNGVDGWIVTAPVFWPAEACSASDDCPRSDAPDERWVVTIPEAGDWIFTVCGAAWDTTIAIGTTPCGDEVGGNDDGAGCGAASEVVLTLDAGTYHVTVEGFAAGDCGPYTLVVGRIR